MGTETSTTDIGVVENVNDSNGNGNGGKTAGNSSSSTTRRRKSGRNTDGTGNNGTVQGEPRKGLLEEKELSELASVNEKEAKRLERNAKRREKYAQTKGKTTNKVVEKTDSTQIKMLLNVINTIITSRENMQIFVLSEKEIESIAEPLSNIINKNENVQKLLEHSDEFNLSIACLTIFVPRIIVYLSNKPRKEKNKSVGNNRNTTESAEEKSADQSGKNTNSNGRTNTKTSENSTTHGGDLLDFLSGTA